MKTTRFLKIPRRSIPATSAIYCIIFACSLTQAATITWTNAAGGWNTAINWSPNAVPGSNDTAVIPQGVVSLNSATTAGGIVLGTNGPGATSLSLDGFALSLNGPITVHPSASLTIDSGTLVGNTNASLHGLVSWSSGLLGGTLSVASDGTLLVTNAVNHDMPNCILTNNGTILWTAGDIRSGGGSPGTFIYNYGGWTAQSDNQLTTSGYNGQTTFNNYGTLRKTNGSPTSQTTIANSVLYNQSAGELDVQAGNLSLQGSGNFTGGFITTNATGTTLFAQGSFNLNGTATGSNVIENAGNLVGTNVINGAIQWVAGTWNNTVVTIPSNSLVVVEGGTGNNDLADCILTNYGTWQWASGTLRSGSSSPGTFIYNYGVWEAQSDEDLTTSGYNGQTTFNNYGVFRKTAGSQGSQTAFSGGTVLNQIGGAIDVQQGSLTLQGTGNFTGGTANNPAGTINLTGDSDTINGTAITNFIQNGANLTGTNSLKGGFTWIAGLWNSTVITIPTNSLVVIAGGTGYNDMANTILTNYGTVLWQSGTIRSGSSSPGTFVYNYGNWLVECDEDFTTSGYNGATVFNNYGTFTKETTGGDTTFSSGTTFNSSAGVTVVSGMLVLQGAGNFPAGTLNIENAGLNLEGGGELTGVALTNTGIIYLDGGNITINGTTIGTNTVENGGNLVGTNVINGYVTWISGNWNSAVVTVTSNSIVTITNAAVDHDLANCIFTNYGIVIWNSGDIRSGGSTPGTFIYNFGTWDAQSDQQLTTSGYNGNATFNNYSIFRKSGGASEFASATTFQSPIPFNQLAGVIDVQDGTNGLQLSLQAGGSFTGGFITTNKYGLTTLGSGNFNLNGTVTGTNTWENGGNLIGTTTINNALTWVSGNWNTAPSATLVTNGLLIIISANDHDLANCSFTNFGTVLWNSGDIRCGSGSPGTYIYNYGLWNAQDDQQLTTSGYNGNATFNNYGRFIKTGGSSTSQTLLDSPVFLNQPYGVLDIQQGNLTLQGGANLNGGYITTNTTGTTFLSAGNFNLNGTATGTNVIENGGNLVGTNVIKGALEWFDGNWDSAPYVTITTNSALLVISANDHDLPNCILTNSGIVTWNSGDIRSGSSSPGTYIYNYGVWNAQSDQQLTTSGFNGSTFFNNYGIFRKSAGTNTTFASGIELNQLAGAIDIQQGSLTFQGTGNFAGGTANNPAGIIYLTTGVDNINGTATANMIQNTANLVGTNVINGNLTWEAGVWNSIVMTILNGSTVTVAGGTGNDNDMANCILTNKGTLVWNSGNIRSGSSSPGTFIYNYGLWAAQCDQTLTTSGYNGDTIFNNFGTLLKQYTSGATTLASGVTLTNTGTMNAQSGDILLQGPYTLVNGTQMTFGLNGTGNNGQITLPGPATFSGSVSANFNNPFYWPTVGSTFTLLNYTSEAGTLFPRTNLPAFITWQTNYNPTDFSITVAARSTNPAPSTLFYTKTSPTNLFLEWYGDHTGWQLQSQTNSLSIGLSNNWTVVTGSGLTNQILTAIAATNPTVFFRMIYP
ncbi:MAG: hypothetical protein ABSH48_21360 [Verrucomicrobiota bacterium]